jgi:hypothetical protein
MKRIILPNNLAGTFSPDNVRAATHAVGRTPGVILFSALVPVAALVLGLAALLLTGFTRQETEVYHRELVTVSTARIPEAEAALRSEVNRAEHIGALLAKHRDGAAPLRLISEHAQAEVGIRSVNVDYATATISLDVHAPTLAALAQQVAVFEDDARVHEVSNEQMVRRDEPPRFETTIRIVFDPALLAAFPELQHDDES